MSGPRSLLSRMAVGMLACAPGFGVCSLPRPPAPPTPTAPAAPAALDVAPVTIPDPGFIVTPGQNVPDPFVVKDAGLYYLFASQGQFFGPNVPVMVSTSLTNWGPWTLDAMPTLPRWAGAGFTWSPDVRKLGSHYVMWFNADVAGTGFDGTKCIGVATATSVVGPYESAATAPLVCQTDHLGSIDPRTFLDPRGRLWLLWKSDDNAAVNGTSHSTIWVQRLRADGTQLVGKAVPLMSASLPWEGRIIEAPDMVYANGDYWLFFSANWFNQPAYAIGVAQCAGPTGPCTTSSGGPWLSSNQEGSGPGEESFFNDGSRWFMLYAPNAVNYQAANPRPAAIARVLFGAGGPALVPPLTVAWSAVRPARLLHAGSGVSHPVSATGRRRPAGDT